MRNKGSGIDGAFGDWRDLVVSQDRYSGAHRISLFDSMGFDVLAIQVPTRLLDPVPAEELSRGECIRHVSGNK